ncbi:3-oxoacyl-ACP reductase FabG [Candidatus Aerophobetes bacterium]|nr:3-oxoacyl-ACP reductase FabG [Candidatus Aerophobetes bacterium]
MERLKNKVSIITGSSRGIGRAIALRFAREGSNIVITYHTREDKAKEVVEEIKNMGRRVIMTQVDVSRREDVRKMVKRSIDEFGKIDILVNNAGILQQKPFEDITDEDWDRMFEVNMKGVFLCTQEVLPWMKRQRFGKIINISSVGGQFGGPKAVHYSATKAGVICFTKSIARIASPFNINVNAISPGLILTEMSEKELNDPKSRAKIDSILLKRIGKIEDVAGAAVFLASAESEYITGQVLNVNGGLYLG